MAELTRTFTVRTPAGMSKNDINSLGIHSHPVQYQSGLFRDWMTLCDESKVEELNVRIVEYLRGTKSVKKISDLGVEWSYILNSFQSHGDGLNKEIAYKILKDSRVTGLFSEEKRCFSGIWTDVADTMLGLAYLKKLSYKGNIDYQSVLRVLAFVERCFDLQFDLPELTIKPYLTRPVLLPPCFFKLDPCSNKRTSTGGFSFLDDLSTISPEKKSAKGCTADGNCTCIVNDECVNQNPCCAKIKLNIIDLMMVRDYTKCYQAGDLSYIKNILAGESLETKHRRLEKIEEYTETEEYARLFEERYLQTEEKTSLQKEMEKTNKKDTAFNAGVTTNLEYGSEATYKFKAEGSTSFGFTQSKSEVNKEVRDYSKDLVDRAIKSVEETVKKLVSTRTLFETEETNDHSFNNASGPNISGQYLYVNKVSKAEVINYGKKVAIEIFLPEPSSLFKKLLENKFKGVKPKEPSLITIDPKTITPENVEGLISTYGLKDVPPAPNFETIVTVTLEGEPGDPKGNKKSGSDRKSVV